MNKSPGYRAASAAFATFLLAATAHAAGNLDQDIGAESDKLVATQMGIYDDPSTTAWVRAVGERLVGALQDDRFTFRFQVVDDASPNAFALPGGFVYVTRGILPLMQSEDELAGVIAHEIIHVTERHGVRRSRRGLFGEVLQAPGRIVGGIVSPAVGGLINAPIAGASKLALASYSRGQEREADKQGIELMARSGYDPAQLGRFLARLADYAELLTGQQEKRTMLADHPVTPDRVSYLGKSSGKLRFTARPPVEGDLLSALDGLTYGPNPNRGVFDGGTFLHPGLDLALEFPADWQTFNMPVAVGAIEPSQKAALFYALADTAKSPAEHGRAFTASLPAEYRNQLARSESVLVNGLDAYVVTLAQSPKTGGRIYLHMAWANFGDYTLRLAAYGGEPWQDTLRNSARSFRRLDRSDRAAIRYAKIAVASARPGESIEEFSRRAGNRWPLDVTRLLNGIEVDELEEQRYRIMTVSPFFGR